MTVLRIPVFVAVLAAALSHTGYGAVYRVGPGEESRTISGVASRLTPGDTVEVTGDVRMRGDTWELPETREFVKRRGNGDPVLEGSNNWVFERSTGMPEAFGKALRGLNPKFADLLRGDYRPRKDSPLAGAGLWPLPKGRVVDLAPEYEPQRGIPADLKPRPRRKVTPPSIGPFEVPEE